MNLIEVIIVKIANLFLINKNIEKIKKVFRQDNTFFQRDCLMQIKRLKIFVFLMVNTNNNTTEDTIKKLQTLRKTNLNFSQKLSNYFDEIIYRRQSGYFHFQGDLFRRGAQSICKHFHEVLFLRKNVQTKPQVKSTKTNNYEFYYTVFKNLADNEDEGKHEISDDIFQIFYLMYIETRNGK